VIVRPRRARPAARACAQALALGAALVAAARAEPLPPQDRIAQPRTVISATRRFVVSGLPAARAADVARWAEELAERIQRQAGPLPFERHQHILIEASIEGEPAIAPLQHCEDGVVAQTLAIRGLDRVLPEDAEEALGSLLVSRYIHALQPASARCPEPMRASDWLVVALVHASQSDLRRRDLDHALARRLGNELTPFAELVEQHVMPPGRWPQKADAMALWLWLSESPRAAAMLAESFRLQATGRRPDAAWWAAQRIGAPDPAAAAREWESWLDARQERARPVGSGDVNAVLRLRLLPAHELVASGGPRALADQPLVALIPHRKEPWCRQAAIRLALRARLEAIGHEEEAQRLAESYARFLDRVAKSDSPRRLNALWKEAEQQHARFVALLDARRRFLDAVETRIGAPRPPENPVSIYLDAVEARMNAARAPDDADAP
jgi:hypothetical protein